LISVSETCAAAAAAARALARLDTMSKNEALGAMAAALRTRREYLVAANAEDLELARSQGVAGALIDRLSLTDSRIDAMADGLLAVAAQPDPVGEIVESWRRPDGLLIQRVRAPLGVIGVIYEARPNVTADVVGLCLKSGNASVLRGSSIAVSSNRAIVEVLRSAASATGIPDGAFGLIDASDRASAIELMQAKGLVDLLVPRGGPELIRTIEENATVPVIIDGDGNCHVYVDASADLDMATSVILNAKTQRPSVCNAAETLLVHSGIADLWLPGALDALAEKGVEIRGDERVRALWPKADEATEADWATEYLDLVLAVRVVDSVDAAVEHINRYGTSNAEAIITRDITSARRFTAEVDSGTVFVNASTRFSDGGEFGYGAEIGISTQKLHARGPMGPRELTSTRYLVWGDGHIRT
jgi:glutamate-5-semialdehyde dehydrogenase